MVVQFFITLSCIVAVGVNASQFICIGRFSAVTFQVLGHMKTILVLVLGFLFFNDSTSTQVTAPRPALANDVPSLYLFARVGLLQSRHLQMLCRSVGRSYLAVVLLCLKWSCSA